MNKILDNHEDRVTRFLEILPGLLAWTIILFPLIGGIFFPTIVAYCVLIFIAYWLFKSFKSAILAIKGYLMIKESEKINWKKKWKKDKTETSIPWDEVKHVFIVPTYNESEEVLSRSLDGIAGQKQIDLKNVFVFLAMEERAKGAEKRAKSLIKKYKKHFGHMDYTMHPDGIVGEVRGKAANEAWAAKSIEKYLKNKKIDIEKTTVTSCDSDAIFHPNYFAALTYNFSTNKDRYVRIWQSPIFWFNNLHKVPFPVRIVGSSGHPVHLANLQDPSKLMFNYSSYSLSFKLLRDTGYWDVDIIPEDWHLFLQTFFHTEGKVEVDAVYLPTHIDAPESPTWGATLKNRYEQCKRHAWGATDIPYAIKESIRHKEIPLARKGMRVWKMIEGHMIWSTNWFLLTLGPLLPLLINPAFSRTMLGYSLPRIARIILTICLIALVVMVTIDIKLRPEKARPKTASGYAKEFIQWFSLPFVTLFLSVLPGLHSQTLLMLGKRLEYKVTEKV